MGAGGRERERAGRVMPGVMDEGVGEEGRKDQEEFKGKVGGGRLEEGRDTLFFVGLVRM